MSKSARAWLIAGAAVIAVAALVIVRPSDDQKDRPDPPSQAATNQTVSRSETAPRTTATAPPVPRVRAVGLKPVGGVRTITAQQGDVVRFTVTSDQAENVHLHGYDVERAVGPDNPARFRFKANITGIFEVELEGAGQQLIKLVVEQ